MDDRSPSTSLLKVKESTSNWRIIPFQNNLTICSMINTDRGTNWKQGCIINFFYPQRLRFNEWIFVYNFSCQWRKMLRILQMLKRYSSWGSLTSRSQRRINFSEQQGREYNPVVKNVMRFVLSGGGGGGGGKKVTREAPPRFPTPYPFIYLYHCWHRNATPFVYLILKNGIPFTYLLLELCIPFSCCKYTVLAIWINHKTRTFSWLFHSH